MGPYRGGQAQFIRVPYADFNALTLPPGTENEADFIVCFHDFPFSTHRGGGLHGVLLEHLHSIADLIHVPSFSQTFSLLGGTA